VNYTREPIIETVITPREGCKIVLRNSKKGQEHEDYLVDAVEVVSFGKAIFFRSLERPKPFLLPVEDYEIVELKETKMVLKAALPEKAIKIAGGKEEPKQKKETTPKKTLKRRTRRKTSEAGKSTVKPTPTEGGEKNDETKVSSSHVSRLLPPPTTLIKEKLSRIKNETIPTQPAEEKKDIDEKSS
jgi:hypothetical protein